MFFFPLPHTPGIHNQIVSSNFTPATTSTTPTEVTLHYFPPMLPHSFAQGLDPSAPLLFYCMIASRKLTEYAQIPNLKNPIAVVVFFSYSSGLLMLNSASTEAHSLSTRVRSPEPSLCPKNKYPRVMPDALHGNQPRRFPIARSVLSGYLLYKTDFSREVLFSTLR